MRLNSRAQIIFGRCLRRYRSFAVVAWEIDSLRNYRKFFQVNFPGNPSLLSPTAFNRSAGVDWYVISGSGEQFLAKSRELLAYLVQVHALRVVVLVKTHCQPEFVVSHQLFLCLDPRDVVQMVTTVQITVFRIGSPIVEQSPRI